MFDDIEIRPATDDSRVDDLAIELVSLAPDWQNANADYTRSVEILGQLDDMGLSPWQKKQVVTYVQSHWTVAATQATQLGLFNGAARSSYQHPLSQILAGVCLVKSQGAGAAAAVNATRAPA